MPLLNKLVLTETFTKAIWSKLKDSHVPIVDKSDIRSVSEWVGEINSELSNRSYIPSISHGNMEVEKSSGVMRFVPILTKEDMAVYYHLCGEIGDKVIVDEPDVFGGWRIVPKTARVTYDDREARSEAISKIYQQGYYSDPLSNAAWFQGYTSYTDLIFELSKSNDYGNFVARTDIANFYDSIDVPRLCRKLTREIPGDHEKIEVLEMFLGLWGRNTSGYQRSSKGIPQEIISDGSRNLSHFYLQDFDVAFKSYCEAKGLRYVRWADDMLIFGKSRVQLEDAIHQASELLMEDGLNLNAGKTKVYGRREFLMYRGMPVLSAINSKSIDGYRRELKTALRWQKETGDLKVDTIFRASIGFLTEKRRSFVQSDFEFLLASIRSNPELIGSLNSKQLYRTIRLSGEPKKFFSYLEVLVLRKRVSQPKMAFLRLLRDNRIVLEMLGISRDRQQESVRKIQESSDKESLLNRFCIPSY